jgi:tetratricopeptide (TPR) repeat protein
LARAYQAAGRLAEAAPLFEETLKLMKEQLGPSHPHTLASMNNLARAYQLTGRLAEALPLMEETLKLRKEQLGPKHPDTLISMGNLASGYQDAGRLAEALPLYEETLKLLKEKLGPTHHNTLTGMNNLATAYQAAGRLADALPLFAETLKLREEQLGLTHRHTLGTLRSLGRLQIDLKAYPAAEGSLLEYQARVEKNARSLPPEWQTDALPHLVRLYDAWGKPAEAEKWRVKLPPALRVREAMNRQNAWPLLWGWPRF